MRTKIIFFRICLLLGIIIILSGITQEIYARDLKASVAYIPLLSESPDRGAFVEFVKAIDDVYTEGKISIEVYPFARSINNVVTGSADFHVPMMRSPYLSLEDKPFRFAKQRMGIVCHVIYSHINNPITKEQIRDGLSKSSFPYSIDVVLGTAQFYNFPTYEIPKLQFSLKRIKAHRIDALIAAQEEGDFEVNALKAKFIQRSLFECWDDVIIIPKGPRGDEIDKILDRELQELEKTGRLKEIRKRIHVPYVVWQPSEKDW